MKRNSLTTNIYTHLHTKLANTFVITYFYSFHKREQRACAFHTLWKLIACVYPFHTLVTYQNYMLHFLRKNMVEILTNFATILTIKVLIT